ncbi:MAG: 4Fe-4S binding protein [Chloroflexi bacterium]|nr:4Fe-4S binding protein [Chloroflexota bacterium]
MPVVKPELCNGCGLCAAVCSCNALLIRDKIAFVVQNCECDWCTDCEAVCPTAAISCPYTIVAEDGEVV